MKIFIETMGCPKNLSDTQMFEGILNKSGHSLTNDAEEANCIIVNTCGFINDAKIESIDKIFEMAKLEKTLVVTGCLSQRYGEELYEEIPEIDIITGVNDYVELAKLLTEKDKTEEKENNGDKEKSRVKLLSEYKEEKDLYTGGVEFWENRTLSDKPWTSTLKISEGCDNNCAYCVIPSIRGGYRSRTPEAILAEAKHLVSQGVKEIILIGQDTTNYGTDLKDQEINTYAKLVKELCKIDGLSWIRLMYCYEDKIGSDLIEVIASEEKVCNYLDIPLQHAAGNVLRGMRRKSTEKSIRETLKELKEKVEDIHIRTTFIVGFPGETEEDFDKLYDLAEEEKFERLGVFAYSREEGTPAADMDNQIDEEIKEERKNSIMNLQMELSLKRNLDKIGKTLEVLIEEEDEGENTYIGRTRYDAPEIDNGVLLKSNKPLNLGDIVLAKVIDGFDYDIVCEAIN